MRLGIDLGTTRTVVAASDRGNYPVVGFADEAGDVRPYFPSVVAETGGQLVHGFAAEAAANKGAPCLRSFKRLLAGGSPLTPIQIGTVRTNLSGLLDSYVGALRVALLSTSNIDLSAETGDLEAAISVPANAHSTQRFLTLEAFRRSGFAVSRVINEPSAAGIEYAHRHRNTINSRREHVIVYDLGGGTFDTALVHIAGSDHRVLTTAGINRLGGDDFDEALLAIALAERKQNVDSDEIRDKLLVECRAAKEALNPNSRRIVLELEELNEPGVATSPVVIAVSEYYESVRPLIARTLDALAPVVEDIAIEDEPSGEAGLAGIYMVGGATGLPIVARIVRERFGRRVHRSPHPSAATAIGLAIAASETDAPDLRECFTRHFGVFREERAGSRVSFDGIFEKGTPIPTAGGNRLRASRRYRAAHNLGHFRFVESGQLSADGDPTGDITPHGEIRFPFDAASPSDRSLDAVPIERLGTEGPEIEERYEVDASGAIAVTITNLENGHSARYEL